MSRFLFTLLTILSLTSYSSAHSWYPVECCSGQDCHPVDCSSLTEDNDGGFTYHGDGFTVKYPKDKVRVSQDNTCHVCFGDYSKNPYCVFIQPTS